MASMGRYCKAYPVESFETFPQWNPQITLPGDAPEEERYYFLQENFIVTRGVFLDEDVVFDAVTDEWKDFCLQTLSFVVPVDELDDSADEQPAAIQSSPM